MLFSEFTPLSEHRENRVYTRSDILEYVEQEQKGKRWIYPYVLARSVASAFGITQDEAESIVWEHIHKVIAEQ